MEVLSGWIEQALSWAATERESRLSPKTVKDYMHDLKAFARWMESTQGGQFIPEQLTEAAAEAWKQSELDRGRRPNSVNRALAALRLLAEWLKKTGQTEGYVLDRLSQAPADQAQTFRWLELPEIVRLYRAIKTTPGWSERRRLMVDLWVRLMTEAGLRVEEVTSLHRDDIMLEPAGGAHLVIRAGRGGHSRRVPLNRDVRAVLAEWLQVTSDESPWLFPGSRAEKLGAKTITTTIRTVATSAGLEDVTCQNLRVTCGHMLYRTTKDLWTVALLMGHFSADGEPSPASCVNYVYRPGMDISTPNVDPFE